ncbi:MAG: hypothetical protein ACTSW4_02310 [Candidatus Ranarchaeia archaeon]
MLITFKCTACGQLISFNADEEEVKKAKIFPFPVVIQHGDHAQVVYLDRALGIREVEIARHAETLLDHFIGFFNEALLTEKHPTTHNIGLSIGRQIGEFLLSQLHEGKPFMNVTDAIKSQGEAKVKEFLERDWRNLWEVFTSSMKSVFSGGTITYSLDKNNFDHVTFEVVDNPFCRTLADEKKKKCCDILAGIIAGAASSMRADDTVFNCEETNCHIINKKGHCNFDLKPVKAKERGDASKKKG